MPFDSTRCYACKKDSLEQCKKRPGEGKRFCLIHAAEGSDGMKLKGGYKMFDQIPVEEIEGIEDLEELEETEEVQVAAPAKLVADPDPMPALVQKIEGLVLQKIDGLAQDVQNKSLYLIQEIQAMKERMTHLESTMMIAFENKSAALKDSFDQSLEESITMVTTKVDSDLEGASRAFNDLNQRVTRVQAEIGALTRFVTTPLADS